MNERILELRTRLGLTLEELGGRLGVTRSAISNIEKGRRGVTKQMVNSICREFGVSEKWLRNGEGDMFGKNEPENPLDTVFRKYRLNASERALVETFLTLDVQTRGAVVDFIRKAAEAMANDYELDIDAEVEAYRRELERQKRQGGKSPASAG